MYKKPFPNRPFLKRDAKPRETGINYVSSPVMVGQCIEDYLEAYSHMLDIFNSYLKSYVPSKPDLRFLRKFSMNLFSTMGFLFLS